MKIYRILFLLILTTIIGCKSNVIDQLKKDFSENSLFVLNDKYVLIEPLIFLDKINESVLLKVVTVSNDSIEYENSFESIIKIYTDSTTQIVFNESKWIEYRFVKKVNPKNKLLYMLDGMPTHDYKTVFTYLTQRIITKLNFIPSNHAIGIWGKRLGENGAIQIWTEKREGETIIPIIIK